MASLASAREGRSGLQATLAAIDDALRAMQLPPLLGATSRGKESPTLTVADGVASGANGAKVKSEVAARVEQLCALFAEQRGALRVTQSNEAALREELSRLRTKSEALSDEIAAHVVKEGELSSELQSAQEGAAAAESRATGLAAEVDAVHTSAKAEAARRVEARSDELAMLEAEMSQTIKGVTLDHAADAASLQAELQAARMTLQAEGSRHDQEVARLRGEFEDERRELSRIHRRALQAAEEEMRRVERKAEARAAGQAIITGAGGGEGGGGGEGNVVTQIFRSLKEGWEGHAAASAAPQSGPPMRRSPAKQPKRPPHAKALKDKAGRHGQASPSRRPPSSDGRWRTPNNAPLTSPLRLAPAGRRLDLGGLSDTASSNRGTPSPSSSYRKGPYATPPKW